jgi:hypothetical protein
LVFKTLSESPAQKRKITANAFAELRIPTSVLADGPRQKMTKSVQLKIVQRKIEENLSRNMLIGCAKDPLRAISPNN